MESLRAICRFEGSLLFLVNNSSLNLFILDFSRYQGTGKSGGTIKGSLGTGERMDRAIQNKMTFKLGQIGSAVLAVLGSSLRNIAFSTHFSQRPCIRCLLDDIIIYSTLF